MSDYRRWISYIYAYENGEKKNNAGYARIESRDKRVRITIHLNPGRTDGSVKVCYYKNQPGQLAGVLLGTMNLSVRAPEFRNETQTASLMDTGLLFAEMNGLLLYRENGDYYASSWDEDALNAKAAEEIIRLMEGNTERKEEAEPERMPEYMVPEKEPEKIPKYAVTEKEPERMPEYAVPEKEPEKIPKYAVTEKESEKMPEYAVTEKEPEKIPEYAVPEKEPERMPEYAVPEKEPERMSEYAMPEKEPESIPGYAVPEKEPERMSEYAVPEKEPERIPKYAVPETDNIQETADRKVKEKERKKEMEKEMERKREQSGTWVEKQSSSLTEKPGAVSRAERPFVCLESMNPFEDGELERCVRMEPQDCGMLHPQYWKLASNSFLLHGYYTYHHILYARKRGRDGCSCYLMIPGVFQKKDQNMAMMFGFQGFKSARNKKLEPGDFGYWYRELRC